VRAGDLVPVAVQVAGERVEEDHPRHGGTTRRVLWCVEGDVLGLERVPGAVPGEHVASPAEHERGRRLVERVQQREDAWVGFLPGRLREPGTRGLPGEVVQVDGLDRIELQHPREGVEHLCGRGLGLTLLQTRVVPGTHPRELGELFASQAGDAARGPMGA
jgi:hypothetical protein